MRDEARLKRLRIRAWRRGTKEMDLILGPFCETEAQGMGPDDLDLLEALMEENDQDLYLWVSGQAAPPDRFAVLLSRIARHAGAA
jgi:antitoxin CptB